MAGTKRLQVESLPSKAPSLPAAADADAANLAMLVLNDHGMIQFCSEACEQVFGYQEDELKGRHVSTLLPQLENTDLITEDRVNARLAYLCHCAIPFQAQHRDGNHFAIELFINRLSSQNVVVLVRSLDPSSSNVAVAPLRQCGKGLG